MPSRTTIAIDPALRALADATRLRIMRLIATMELAVGELAQVLGQSQPRVSRHIRILCDAGLAERHKEGSWVFLRSAIRMPEPHGPAIAPSLGATIAELLAVAEAEDAGFAAQVRADRQQLAAIRDAREAAAAAYFARHADAWDELRSLNGPDAPVAAALLAALAGGENGEPAPQPLGALLDIGTGTGRMAELLAPCARQVIGLDNSPEMLRIARARLQHLPADQVTLVQGDFRALPFTHARFDTVLFHQVLHYATEPVAPLAEAARVTRAGGRIAVVDLAAHDREELRSQHAHARLGFSDAQMHALFAAAGFAPTHSTAIASAPLGVMVWAGTRLSTPSPRPEVAI